MHARNPIAAPFGAGINQPRVIIEGKRRTRRVEHRDREWDRDYE